MKIHTECLEIDGAGLMILRVLAVGMELDRFVFREARKGASNRFWFFGFEYVRVVFEERLRPGRGDPRGL